MNAEQGDSLTVLSDLIAQFGLDSLQPTLQACRALTGEDAALDVAVLGQFKSGKSSLLAYQNQAWLVVAGPTRSGKGASECWKSPEAIPLMKGR